MERPLTRTRTRRRSTQQTVSIQPVGGIDVTISSLAVEPRIRKTGLFTRPPHAEDDAGRPRKCQND